MLCSPTTMLLRSATTTATTTAATTATTTATTATTTAATLAHRRLSTTPTKKYDWADPFRMADTLLSDEERMTRAQVRSFCADTLAPTVVEASRAGRFPRELLREMGRQGLLGVTLPERYGCANASNVVYGLIAHEVERIDSGYRSAMSVQSSLVMLPIHEFGTDEQRTRFLPGLASGELVGCFGLTEPNHGSDPAGMETVARLADDGSGDYMLDGSKTWITNSPLADVAVVWAKNAANGGKIEGFLVERGMAGFETPEIAGKLSLRASTTGMIMLDNVRVPAANKFPSITGLRGPFTCLNSARYGIAWGAYGAADACLHAARDYTLERRQFGRPLAANQLVQKDLADMSSEIAIGLLACVQAGRLKDSDDGCPPETISMIKRHACMRSIAIARSAREMLGGNGISDEYAPMRHAVNLEAVNTYEGTNSIHALILGRQITGIQAFSADA